jgi:hypothetical protein
MRDDKRPDGDELDEQLEIADPDAPVGDDVLPQGTEEPDPPVGIP